LYLIYSNTLKDFWFSNFTYNTLHYINIANYTPGISNFNPLRFALTVINNFWVAYLPLLSQLAHPSFYQPISRLVGLGTITLLIYLLYTRPVFGIFYLILLSFSAPRSAQLVDMKETDYQMGLFIILGSISAIFALYQLLKDLDTKSFFVKFCRSVVCIWLLVYLVFTTAFAVQNTLTLRYQRYMGTLPPIANISDIADFVSSMTESGDAFWIGPYEGNHSFFVKDRVLAGKYPSLLPQFREDEYLKNDFLGEMQKYKPAIIVFNHEASIFMTPAVEFGRFFLDWMKTRYVNCTEAHVDCKSHVRGINVKNDVYIRKDLQKLFSRM
jgi:hypothetical protein